MAAYSISPFIIASIAGISLVAIISIGAIYQVGKILINIDYGIWIFFKLPLSFTIQDKKNIKLLLFLLDYVLASLIYQNL